MLVSKKTKNIKVFIGSIFMDKSNLIELGLGKSEAEIYLALLKLGKSTSTTLTKETGIHRTYIYDVLEKLNEKGLISHIKEKGKKFFLAAEPSRLKDYLNEKLSVVEKILPELEMLNKKKIEGTHVEVFKGREGIKIILNDIVREGKDYFAMGVLHYFEKEEYLSEIFVNQWLVKINDKKIKERLILEKGTSVKPIRKSEHRYLPKEFLFLSSFIVYGDKVAIFTWGGSLIQIVIKNKDVAQSYETQFNALWKIAKK